MGYYMEDFEFNGEVISHDYECSCGEAYETLEDAIRCRKCRTYTLDGYCTAVHHKGSLVWKEGGTLDRAMEAEATKEAEKKYLDSLVGNGTTLAGWLSS